MTLLMIKMYDYCDIIIIKIHFFVNIEERIFTDKSTSNEMCEM